MVGQDLASLGPGGVLIITPFHNHFGSRRTSYNVRKENRSHLHPILLCLGFYMETNMVAEPGSMPGSSSGVDLGGWAQQPVMVPPQRIAADGMPDEGPPPILGMQTPVLP